MRTTIEAVRPIELETTRQGQIDGSLDVALLCRNAHDLDEAIDERSTATASDNINGMPVRAKGFPSPADRVGTLHGIFSKPDSTYGPHQPIDMEQGRLIEGESTIGDRVGRARQQGIETPIAIAARRSLEAHEAQRRKSSTERAR